MTTDWTWFGRMLEVAAGLVCIGAGILFLWLLFLFALGVTGETLGDRRG